MDDMDEGDFEIVQFEDEAKVEEDTTTDINEYRELRKNITEHEEALAQMNKMRADIEATVFSFVKTGEYVDYEEFRFEAKVGPRGLSPRAGFENTWKNLIADCEVPEDKEKLQKLIVSKVVFKGPTLAKLEKTLSESDFLREYYEEAKLIFGYKDGNRHEVVTVLDAAPDDSVSGLYCHSKVAGTTYRGVLPWEDMKAGDALELIREPGNEYSRAAIKIMWNKDVHIGYVRDDLAQTLAPMMDNGTEFVGRISAITGGVGTDNHGCNIDIIYS